MLVIISDRTEAAEQLAEMIFDEGVFLYRVPFSSGLFTCQQKDTGGVLVDCVSDPASGREMVNALWDADPELPIAVLHNGSSVEKIPATVHIREREPSAVVADVLQFGIDFCGWRRGALSTPVLFMNENAGTPCHYLGRELYLPESEHTLLRCLLYRYPKVTDADDLLSLCFRGRKQKISSISVLIARINRRISETDPRRLIINIYGQGYRLRDGICATDSTKSR